MIITRLIGGLGNQMFHYAVGRRLAHVLGTELKLDISAFQSYKLRTYSLGNFNIREKFASPKEVLALTRPTILERIRAKALRRRPWPPRTYVREKQHFHFDPKILSLPDGVYLDGYWQSEKYFVDIAGIIRLECTVKTPQTEKNKEIAEMITATESVSLHVRCGDYISNPHTRLVHGSCNRDYYFRCVEYLTQTVKNPHFFIFSDDPEWVRENLKLSYPMTLVDHNGAEKDYEDLRLMSQCKYHIIANSSFSWWGAWLSPWKDKIVFSPKRWFAKSKTSTQDLIPAQWLRR